MVEESPVSVYILCIPESEVTLSVRSLLDQKGTLYYMLPVGAHFIEPQLPATRGVALIPLCRELVEVAPVELLRRLVQNGVTLLPLGREDAPALWNSMTAGMERSFAELEVFQLEDPWDMQLPVSQKNSAEASPIFSHTIVNRNTPLLREPLVDLNLPETPATFPVRFRPASQPTAPASPPLPRALAYWLLFLLFVSALAFPFALWKHISPASPKERQTPETPETSSPAVVAESAEVSPREEKSELPEPPEGASHSENKAPAEVQDFSRPYEFDSSAFFSGGDEKSAVQDSFYFQEPGQTDDAPARKEGRTLFSAEDEAARQKPAPLLVAKKPRVSKPQALIDERKVARQKEKKTDAPSPPVAARSVPDSQARVAAHRCPTPQEVRKAAKGGFIFRLIEAGAHIGCPTCRKNLEYLLRAR